MARLLVMKNILVSLLLLLSILSLAQDQEKLGYAFHIKSGPIISNKFDGFGAGLELNLTKGKRVYSILMNGGSKFDLLEKPNKEVNSLGFMYGMLRNSNNDLFCLYYQGGLGVVWGMDQGEYLYSSGGIGGWFNLFSANHYKKQPYLTFGIPVKIGVKIIPLKFLSMGLEFNANINVDNSFIHPMLSIELGKIK